MLLSLERSSSLLPPLQILIPFVAGVIQTNLLHLSRFIVHRLLILVLRFSIQILGEFWEI